MSGETPSAYTDPMVVCPSCGTENPDRARFCLECGVSLEPAPHSAEERKLVTVLFADLADSTALGARLDPEALKDVLARFFAAMREQIEAEGGTVEKFIGDAVMAAFGVPGRTRGRPRTRPARGASDAAPAGRPEPRARGGARHRARAADRREHGRGARRHGPQVGRGDGDRRRGQRGGPAPAGRRARPDPRRRPHRSRGARIRPRAGGSPRCARKVHPGRRDDPRGRA